jgi:hypothetical protein
MSEQTTLYFDLLALRELFFKETISMLLPAFVVELMCIGTNADKSTTNGKHCVTVRWFPVNVEFIVD